MEKKKEDKTILKCFEYLEKMDKRITKRISKAKVGKVQEEESQTRRLNERV